MAFESKSLTVSELLNHYTLILDELRERGVVRTANSPIGDYAEWLVAKRLDLKLENNSNSGYDAIDRNNIKYQIKSRRITPKNPSTQLSVIRNLESHDFDFLIGVLFNAQVKIQKVIKIPHEIIHKYAKHSKYVNGHILILREGILSNPLTEDITQFFHEN
jgi:hypothetical protein